MSMSRKDFEAMAADIRIKVTTEAAMGNTKAVKEIEEFVCFAILPTLLASNRHFDRDRFLAACGF